MKKTNGKGSQRAVQKGIQKGAPEKNGADKISPRYLHDSSIDLHPKLRAQVCELLNQTLAESLDLYTQTKHAHWNVKGVHFYQLHLLFDELATELADFTDMFAERITSLGGVAFGTTRMAAKSTKLPEFPIEITEGMDYVAALAQRFAAFGRLLRNSIEVCGDLDDADTQDLYTQVSRDIDKRLWFLEAHLQAVSAEHETVHALVAAKPRR